MKAAAYRDKHSRRTAPADTLVGDRVGAPPCKTARSPASTRVDRGPHGWGTPHSVRSALQPGSGSASRGSPPTQRTGLSHGRHVRAPPPRKSPVAAGARGSGQPVGGFCLVVGVPCGRASLPPQRCESGKARAPRACSATACHARGEARQRLVLHGPAAMERGSGGVTRGRARIRRPIVERQRHPVHAAGGQEGLAYNPEQSVAPLPTAAALLPSSHMGIAGRAPRLGSTLRERP